jgi:hypothetical protein
MAANTTMGTVQQAGTGSAVRGFAEAALLNEEQTGVRECETVNHFIPLDHSSRL